MQAKTFRFLVLISALAAFCAVGIPQSGRRQAPSSPVIVTTVPVGTKGDDRTRRVNEGPTDDKQATIPDGSGDKKSDQTGTTSKPADSTEEVGPDDVLRVSSNLVTVPVSVVGPDGRALTSLTLRDFELRVDGDPKPITDLYRSETPVKLALLFDNSSSLTASRELEKQAAVRFFRNVMRPQDQAAIFNVYTDVVLAQPLTNNVSVLVRTIESFGKPEGATSLFDAVDEAAKYLSDVRGRKVVVIVSDGADTTSRIDFETALKNAQLADCQIYVVQTGLTRNNANLRDLTAERRMQELSGQTGGAVYVPLTSRDLDDAFEQIAADLAQQYVLSYYPKNEVRDGRFRTISLRVPSQPRARIRARKGYYARTPARA